MHAQPLARIVSLVLLFSPPLFAQTLPRSEWGAPDVSVSHAGGKWIIAGKKNKVTLDEKTLALTVQNGSATWAMVASGPNDMLVKADKQELSCRLADAKRVDIKPYDTGFKTGVKIMLGDWLHRNPSNALGIDL